MTAPAERPHLRVAASDGAPKPPSHLRAATRRWWSSVVRDYELEPHHILLLTAAGEALDRMAEAREAVRRDGPYQRDRYGGTKQHPGIAVERDSRLAFA